MIHTSRQAQGRPQCSAQGLEPTWKSGKVETQTRIGHPFSHESEFRSASLASLCLTDTSGFFRFRHWGSNSCGCQPFGHLQAEDEECFFISAYSTVHL